MNYPGFRLVRNRMVIVTNYMGKHYIPVIGNRWLRKWHKTRTGANEYRTEVQRRLFAWRALE